MTGSVDIDYEKFGVLAVEDDAFQRGLVVQALRVIGFADIREAGDGESALKLCMARLPDVIVCDIEMAPMDGLDFLKALRRTKSGAVRSIPLVFLTSHNDSDTVREAVAAGVDAFIVKPPTLKSLKQRIDAILPGHRGG